MKWIKTTYHFCYHTFWYSVVAVILVIAVGISIIRLYLPDVEEHKGEIENFASSILEQDVLIDSMQAKLIGFTPTIILNDVYLLDETGTQTIVHFDQARLGIDLIRSVYKLKLIPESFAVIGVQLGIHRNDKGNFSIEGLDLDKLGEQFSLSQPKDSNEDLARWFFERSRLSIKNSTIVWDDPKNKKRIQFDNVNFNLLNDEDRHQITATVTLPPDLGNDLEIAFDFRGNILNPSEWSGEVFARAESLNLVNWGVKPSFKDTSIEQGFLGLSLWGKWEKGKLNSFTADLKTEDVTLNLGESNQKFDIELLRGLVDWNRINSGWKLNINKFEYLVSDHIWPESNVLISYDKESDSVSAYASYLKIGDINEVFSSGKLLDDSIQSVLEKLTPDGILTDVHAKYYFSENTNTFFLATNFDSISIKEWQNYPAIKGLTGKLVLNETEGRLSFASRETSVNLPHTFRQPIKVNSIDGEISWFIENDELFLSSTELILNSDDILADLGFSAIVPMTKGSPYLDLQVSYKNGKAIKLKNYLPVSVMNDKLVDWVDNAFLSGTITEGGVVLNGRLDDFPYKNNSGTLHADFNAKDVDLNYQDDWPVVRVNDAEFLISSLGVMVNSDDTTLYNSKLSNLTVSINKFEYPLLKVRAKFTGNTSDIAEFLVTSPISPKAETIVHQSKITGLSSGQGQFQLPLSATMKSRFAMFYEGKVKVTANKIDTWNGQLVTEDIYADINFSPKGVFSDNLEFLVNGGHTKGKIYTQIIDKKQKIEITMQGEMLASKVKNYLTSPMFKELSGKTNWQGVLNFGVGDESGYFQYFSDLKGVSSNLPAPLDKKPDEVRLLDVKFMFPKEGRLPVRINYSDKLSTALVFNLDTLGEKPLHRGEIIFYDEDINEINSDSKKLVASLPGTEELSIRGYLASFNIDDWFEFASENSETRNVGMSDLNIPINVKMEYLNMISNSPEDEDALLRPAKNPRRISLFKIDVKSFKYDDINFGHIRAEVDRHPDGLRFTEIYIDAPYMHVEGEGSWFLRGNRQQTNFVVVATADDIGVALTQLGFSATIKKGRSKAVVQAHWYDAPNRFKIEKLNGNVGVVIEDGVIKEVKPGAGRLLGLFSVSELPRRLLLDFGELKEGLAFQQIIAQLEIKDGDAFSDNVTIISPVALITIEGRTGLAKRDFDQHIRVRPAVSGTIPVISLLAWGGQIGALVFLLETLLGDAINDSIATEYKMTGLWDDPVITKLEKAIPEENQDSEED